MIVFAVIAGCLLVNALSNVVGWLTVRDYYHPWNWRVLVSPFAYYRWLR